MYLNLIRLLWI